MHRYELTLVWVAVLLFSGSHGARANDTSIDKQALDEALELWVSAFNKHDAQALAKEYTEDAEIMMPTGERIQGRTAIEKSFAENFSKNPNIRSRLSDITRRGLAPDIVVEDGTWEESGHSEPGQPTKGHYTTVLVKRNGKWLAIHERGWVLIEGTARR
jgi:uncharacterized protein (TIGR02246 family)